MKLNQIIIAIAIVTSFSCKREAHISVQNKIKGVTIDNIRWGNYAIDEELQPGETSLKREVKELKKEFPMKYYLEFSMNTEDERNYMRTKETYSLDIDQSLEIKIEDATVIYPAINAPE